MKPSNLNATNAKATPMSAVMVSDVQTVASHASVVRVTATAVTVVSAANAVSVLMAMVRTLIKRQPRKNMR